MNPKINRKRINKPIHHPVDAVIENFSRENNLNSKTQADKLDSGDIKFAASILPYSTSYIRDLCRRGILPFDRPAGKYFFTMKNLKTG